MCRAYLITGDNPRKVKYIAKVYAKNSINRGNTDGFFGYKTELEQIRTMELKEWENFINNGVYNFFIGHARLATHGKGKEFVHGWKENGWILIHNGIMQYDRLKKSDSINDSRAFLHRYSPFFGKITVLKEKLEDGVYGDGAILAYNPIKKELLAISMNHTIYINRINGDTITFTSNNDINSFPMKQTIDGITYFYDKYHMKTGKINNSIVRFSVPDMKVLERIPLAVQGWYSKYAYYGAWADTIQNKHKKGKKGNKDTGKIEDRDDVYNRDYNPYYDMDGFYHIE